MSEPDRDLNEVKREAFEAGKRAGAAEEREACAALAKSLRLTGPNLAPAMADYIVDAIRARAT